MNTCKQPKSIFLGDTFSVHILILSEMNALCWFAENNIIIKDITDKIQQTTVHRITKLQLM